MLRARLQPKHETETHPEPLVSSVDTSTHSDKKRRQKKRKRKIADLNPAKRPVWEDADDESDDDKEKKFEKLTGTPKWAKLEQDKDNSDSESDVEGHSNTVTTNLVASPFLAQGVINLKRCPDANSASPSLGKLHSVRFHPAAQILMTAGADQTLKFFQVDGKANTKLHSLFLENFPILSAEFSAGGNEVIMGSRHPSFYCYDMISDKAMYIPKIKGLEERNMARVRVTPDNRFLVFLGSKGNIHLLSAKSKEWVHSLHMSGGVRDVTFTKDGCSMYATGDDGKIYVFDLNTRQCSHSFIDEGCVRGTSIALSHDSHYLACGSNTGVVNIYDKDTCLASSSPKPLKAVMNLTTSCTGAKFNPHTEILALSSNLTEKAVKLVHVPSMTVFSNFPELNDSKIRIPLTVDFSPNGGYFAIGSKQALLFRVQHYSSY